MDRDPEFQGIEVKIDGDAVRPAQVDRLQARVARYIVKMRSQAVICLHQLDCLVDVSRSCWVDEQVGVVL
jgi:hypothetical protein